MRVGSNESKEVDIRLISATNKNLQKMVQENLFREDLLFRINTIVINVPPLRERGEDIKLLVDFYLNIYNKKYEKSKIKISDSAMNKLMLYSWPGNIRELQHAVEKAVILSDDDILNENDFPFTNEIGEDFISETLNLGDLEKVAVHKAINKYKGNISQAAKALGVTRKTLYKKIGKHKL